MLGSRGGFDALLKVRVRESSGQEVLLRMRRWTSHALPTVQCRERTHREVLWRMRRALRLVSHLRQPMFAPLAERAMTEYALILAAVAIVVFVTYEVMGQDIGTLVSNIDKALTAT